MADTFGYSFTPDQSNRMRQSFNSGVLPQNASEALRVLSLRLPAMLAGNPIAPDSLLRGGVSSLPSPAQPGPTPGDTYNPGSRGPSTPPAPSGPSVPIASPFMPPDTTAPGNQNYGGTIPNVTPGGPPPNGAPQMGPSSPSGPMSSPGQAPQIDIQSLLNGLFGGMNSPGGFGSYGNPF